MELYEGIQWTTKFSDWFKEHHGYDPSTLVAGIDGMDN